MPRMGIFAARTNLSALHALHVVQHYIHALPLIVGHILLVCAKYAVKRTRYLGHISRDTTIQHVLGDDSRWVQSGAVFAFVNSVDFPVIYTAFYVTKYGYGRKMTVDVDAPLSPDKQTNKSASSTRPVERQPPR